MTAPTTPDLCLWRTTSPAGCGRPSVLRVHRAGDTDLALCLEHLATYLLAYGAHTVVPVWQTTTATKET